ncbi:sugar kinase [Halobacillus sp. BAB-2008]|uniref:sugar kinase n=1 Tax=Halobacillus sp. BAB-2008 TaxID=1246484 RepID=UPI0002A513FA|nr:sugar kinase [Halobacillus sp. BAB-2008]ELK48442.1 PfkB family carbohydrate kinase [Halobacillus sp. BAB-2008]
MTKIVTLGEVLLRLNAPSYERLKETGMFERFIGGAEVNVSVALSQFGHEVSLVSALPPNDVGENALAFLRKNQLDVSKVKSVEGRMGIYFVEEGYGSRPSKVTYDRSYSSFTNLTVEDFDWEEIFEGCSLFYVSGITPALSPVAKAITLEACKEAERNGITVCFDCNYRSKLWSQSEAKEAFEEIFPYVDICFAGMKDFEYTLGYGDSPSFDRERLRYYYEKASERYGISVFACTDRHVMDGQQHRLQGFLYKDGSLHETSPHTFKVLDRIGGGDSFASGVIHGNLKNYDNQEILEFGLGASILKHTVKGDHFSFTEADVTDLVQSQTVDVAR